MLITIAAVAIVLGMIILSFARIQIPRDANKEGIDDQESTLAYDRVSRWFLFSLIRYVVIRRVKKCQPQGMLMDAGCGPGYLALALARKFPHLNIVGIDVSEEMLALATGHRYSLCLDSQVTFQEANIDHLPFAANSLDFIVSTLSLHHWADPGSSLIEIYRVLKPGGQLLIFDLRRDTPRLLFFIIQCGQRFLAPPPIRRVNGGVGSVWASLTPREMKGLISTSPFQTGKVQSGWGWAYICGKK